MIGPPVDPPPPRDGRAGVAERGQFRFHRYGVVGATVVGVEPGNGDGPDPDPAPTPAPVAAAEPAIAPASPQNPARLKASTVVRARAATCVPLIDTNDRPRR